MKWLSQSALTCAGTLYHACVLWRRHPQRTKASPKRRMRPNVDRSMFFLKKRRMRPRIIAYGSEKMANAPAYDRVWKVLVSAELPQDKRYWAKLRSWQRRGRGARFLARCQTTPLTPRCALANAERYYPRALTQSSRRLRNLTPTSKNSRDYQLPYASFADFSLHDSVL